MPYQCNCGKVFDTHQERTMHVPFCETMKEERDKKTEESKTMPCKACGKPLKLPTEYLNSMRKFREETEAFSEVIKLDFVLNGLLPFMKDRIGTFGTKGIELIKEEFVDKVYKKQQTK